jgi:tetratricopeptide (TPR) repeat protein
MNFRKITAGLHHSKRVLFFAFLSIFALFVPKLISALVLVQTQSLLSFWPALLLNISWAVLSSVSFCFMLFYLVRDLQAGAERSVPEPIVPEELEPESNTPAGAAAKEEGPSAQENLRLDWKRGLTAASCGALILCLGAVLLTYIYPPFQPGLSTLSLSLLPAIPGLIMYLLAGLILLIFAILFLSAAVIVIVQNQSPFKTSSILLKALGLLLHRPFFLLLSLSGTVLGAVLALAGITLLRFFLERIAVSAFLAYFIESAFLAAWAGFILSVVADLAVKSLTNKKNAFTALNRESDRSFSLISLSLLIMAGIFLSIPAQGSLADYLVKAIDSEYATAEKLKVEGQLDLSSCHYKRSYYLAQTSLAYLKLLTAEKDKSYSEAEKNKFNQEFEAVLRETGLAAPGIGLVYYLDALRCQLIKQPAAALASLELARVYAPEFPNSSLLLLELSKTSRDQTQLAVLTESLITQRQFAAYSPLEKKSSGSLQKLSQKIAAKSSASYKNFPLSAYYYYQNKLYPEAARELEALAYNLPDDFAVNYLTAMVDLEMMQDNKQYTAALQAAEKISQMYPNEKWALDLKTDVATKAGKKDVVEAALAQVYLKNPAEIEVAEQYAYSIMSKNSTFTFNESDRQAEKILDGIIQQTADSWFAFYCKAVLDLKKNEFASSLQNLHEFLTLVTSKPEFFASYDDFYYLYTLKYKNLLTNAEAQKALEQIKDKEPLTYNYIQGTFNWSVKDYEKSKIHISQAITLNPNLSKPHFVLGSVYFEQAYLKEMPDNYPLALAEYNKALNIFPNDPYTWFSLGHVYKKLERWEEALGAFQKALYYLPAEDHNFDYYGVSIHSKLQIDEIKNILQAQS